MSSYFCCCRKAKACNIVEPENPKDGLDRYITFTEFPDHSEVDPLELAEAGFFYTGNDDAVKCAFCRVIIRGWSSSDKPILAHLKANRHCDFIKGYPVNNRPIFDDPVRGRRPLLPLLDVICGRKEYLI